MKNRNRVFATVPVSPDLAASPDPQVASQILDTAALAMNRCAAGRKRRLFGKPELVDVEVEADVVLLKFEANTEPA